MFRQEGLCSVYALTSASLPLLDIKPTVAYRVSDWLSVSVGADIFTFWSDLGEGMPSGSSSRLGCRGSPPEPASRSMGVALRRDSTRARS